MFVMNLVFQRASKLPQGPAWKDQMLKLLKIFKTWETLGLFAPGVMNQIAEMNHLRQFVSLFLIELLGTLAADARHATEDQRLLRTA